MPRLSLLVFVLVAPLVNAQPVPEVKLLASDRAAGDYFGYAVARSADGRFALVGALGDENATGSAYVFERSGGAWVQRAKLTASDAAVGDEFGGSVALSGDGGYALVGAAYNADVGGFGFSGSAYVFERSGNTWTEQAKLTASDADGDDTFGGSVALSDDGTAALIGAPIGDDANGIETGSAYVFKRSGSTWAEQAELTASDGDLYDDFGEAVALSADGSRALVGAINDTLSAGSAYVFERSGAAWTQQARLTASDGASLDIFGGTVALSADGLTALIGAPGDDSYTGSAYVYERSGTTWTEQAKLTAPGNANGDEFGASLDLSTDGMTALVGARRDEQFTGSAYVFERRGGTWTARTKLTASDGASSDSFGRAVALSGDGTSALIGSNSDDDDGTNSGSAYVFDLRPPITDAPYVVTLGGASFDEGVGVGVDSLRNAFFVGEFRGTFDFDPGAGVAEITSAQSDVYVASYDPLGGFRFAFPIGNGFATSETAGGIAVSPAGDFVVTGSQPFGAIDFDPDPVGVELRTGRLFVAGYDTDGHFRFAVAPEGPSGANGAGSAVALDASGDVYVAGQFAGELNFAPGASQPVLLTSAGGTDIFLASYDATGAFRSATRLGGPNNDAAQGVAVDASGLVFITGRLDASTLTRDSTGGGGAGPFIASYAPNGSQRFVHVFGPEGQGEAVAIDAAGNVVVVGSFSGTASFDPTDTDGNGDRETVTERAGGSSFVAGYRPDGSFRFVTVSDGTSNTLGLTTLASGVSLVSGTFSGTVAFGPGPDGTLSSGAGSDAFVARYGPAGGFQSVFAVGGDGLNAARAVASADDGYVLLTGSFTNTTDFDPGAGLDERTSAGQNDLFMMKVAPEQVPVAGEPLADAPGGPARLEAQPNPFASRVTLRLSVPHEGRVSVAVYDALGRRVAVLYEGAVGPARPLELVWEAGAAALGLYVVRAEGATVRAVRRIVHVR